MINKKNQKTPESNRTINNVLQQKKENTIHT